ncbi:hypothetical protein C0J52_00087 [Blattella germanica]|nr:hypothetical protein C0J52_00087 [Blattella germanica]
MSHVAKQWGFINNHTQNLYLETEEQEWAGLIASGQTVEADQDDNYPTLGSFPEYFVTGTAIKQALHVGSRTYYPHDDFTVRDSMLADVMRSAKQTLQAVLPSRKVLFINGNLDLMVPPAHNEWMFADIEPSYNWTRRSFVRVEGKVMGYIKKAGNLVTAVLRNCGHYLPRDCPRSTKKVVKKFLAGTL